MNKNAPHPMAIFVIISNSKCVMTRYAPPTIIMAMRQLRKPIPSFIQLKIITLRYIVLGVMLSRSPFHSPIPPHSKYTQTNARSFIPQPPHTRYFQNYARPFISFPIPFTRDTFKPMLFHSPPKPTLNPDHLHPMQKAIAPMATPWVNRFLRGAWGDWFPYKKTNSLR